jgi:hypothetical protein
MKTTFRVHTVMICYHCRTVAKLTSNKSWRKAVPVNQELEVLDIVFVACPECLAVGDVHNPSTARIRKYVDPRAYSGMIRRLAWKYMKETCTSITPGILVGRKFSVTALCIKNFTRIRKVEEVMNAPVMYEAGIEILRPDCGFFMPEDPNSFSCFSVNRLCSGCQSKISESPPPYVPTARSLIGTGY